MLDLLSGFHPFSFWVGFLTAALFIWLSRRILPAMREAVQRSRERVAKRRSQLKLGVEYDYRNDFIRHVQGIHLASPLFNLDEILIHPRILAPAAIIDPDEELLPIDTLSRILPYMPEFPEFASFYAAEKLTLPEAMSRGANLAVMGAPGSGKTTALMHLGTLVASLSPDAGSLADHVPLYIHAADLKDIPRENEDLIAPITSQIWNAGYLSRRTSARFESMMQTTFAEDRALLLVDGLDELPPAGVDQFSAYLSRLLDRHPGIRVAAAVSSHYYDGITALGLVPVCLAGWDHAERRHFIHRWGRTWREAIDPDIWSRTPSGIEPSMLFNWLSDEPEALTPLELTLRTWAAFAGDSLGDRNVDSIEAYVRRLSTGISNSGLALERIGMQMALTNRTVVPARAAVLWSRGRMEELPDSGEPDPDIMEEPEPEQAPGRVGRGAVASLTEAGLLTARSGERVAFSHPVLAGYFAGMGIAGTAAAGTLAAQPNWWLKHEALHYLSTAIDVDPVLKATESPDPLHFGLLDSGKWLRDMKGKTEGRKTIMRRLSALFQDESEPDGLRQRAMAALALSGDPGIPTLCRRLLDSSDFLIRSMCTLVLGRTRDEKYLQDLSDLASDSSFQVRAAACHALSQIDTQMAIETVATVLLHGDEDTQRAAAEALSVNRQDGIELLKEAVELDDLLVRRAAMYGLGKTRSAEAREIIDRLNLEDEQWVVRTAAAQERQKLEEGSPAVPRRVLPLHETPWLIAFAGESGEGMSPGRSAEDILQRALTEGDHEQVLAAMDRFRLSGSDEVWGILYQILENSYAEIQQSAILTLWHLRAQGISA